MNPSDAQLDPSTLREIRYGLMSRNSSVRLASLAEFISTLPENVIDGNAFAEAVMDGDCSLLQKRPSLLLQTMDFAKIAMERSDTSIDLLSALYIDSVNESYELYGKVEKLEAELKEARARLEREEKLKKEEGEKNKELEMIRRKLISQAKKALEGRMTE
uniref:NPH3 domain-containing protein n=1 Tax=Steinernema glaseri TaxID=37863 RepID=A0A1I7YMK0_9BILA